MFQELFQFIGEQAVAAQAVSTVHPEAEPEHRYVLVDRKTGIVEWHEAEPEPRQHTAGDLACIARFLARLEENNYPVAWYDRNGVVLLVNDHDRRDRVTLPLAYSPQLLKLLELEAANPRKSFRQAELILLLRTTFFGCFEDGLLDILRLVKFRTAAAGESAVGHGKSSVGKTIESELTGYQAIPSYVTFTVPVFAAGFRVVGPVECAIEILPDTEQFQLIPIAGTTEGLIAEAERRLGQALTEELGDLQVAVLHGSP